MIGGSVSPAAPICRAYIMLQRIISRLYRAPQVFFCLQYSTYRRELVRATNAREIADNVMVHFRARTFLALRPQSAGESNTWGRLRTMQWSERIWLP
jgi:hypothetical protein